MSLKEILKPKTRAEIETDFCRSHQIDRRELRKFYKKMKWHNGVTSWIYAIFLWVFGVSWMVNAIVALSDKYFWFPIKQTHSMLAFINIFWVISWFAISIIIIIWGIVILHRYFNQDE
jgi:hypothetical protein